MNTKETKLQSGTISEEEYNKYKEKLEKDAVKKAELSKKFDNLNLEDGFLFAGVMRDKRILKEFLNKVLDLKVTSIKFVGEEYYEKPLYGSHGIRLDIIAEEPIKRKDKKPGKRKYFVEIQKEKEYNMGKRTRYYRSVDSVRDLGEGEEYSELPDLYIIFISMEDPFTLFAAEERKADKYHPQKYVFSDYDKDKPDFSLNSGVQTVVLANVKEKYIDKTKEDVFLTEFFRYVANTTDDVAQQATDKFIQKVRLKVNAVKNNPIRREGYMVFELMMQNQLKKGFEEGERRGERRGMKKGMALATRKNAENLLKSGILTVEQIARDLELPVEEVLDIQKNFEIGDTK